MKILFVPYPGTWSFEGGHRTQIRQTAKALHIAGMDVAIGPVRQAEVRGFDIIHFFGLPPDSLEHYRLPAPAVVSPVYFPLSFDLGPQYRRGGFRPIIRQRVRHAVRSARHPFRVRRARVEAIMARRRLLNADALVVNSEAEGRLLKNDLGGDALPPLAVAYSGVGELFFHGGASAGAARLGTSDFVLCVGRIEPRKNQLSLCAAMSRLSLPLVLVGAVLPDNERYMAQCRRLLPTLKHLAHLPAPELADVYAAARVHVLPSWFETTGLATLEAMAAGTPVVVGYNPCTAEYVAECAWMPPPGSVRKLHSAITGALASPRGCERAVAERFSWKRTAKELIDAYTQCLNHDARPRGSS